MLPVSHSFYTQHLISTITVARARITEDTTSPSLQCDVNGAQSDIDDGIDGGASIDAPSDRNIADNPTDLAPCLLAPLAQHVLRDECTLTSDQPDDCVEYEGETSVETSTVDRIKSGLPAFFPCYNHTTLTQARLLREANVSPSAASE